jgi:hypothetical protein
MLGLITLGTIFRASDHDKLVEDDDDVDPTDDKIFESLADDVVVDGTLVVDGADGGG